MLKRLAVAALLIAVTYAAWGQSIAGNGGTGIGGNSAGSSSGTGTPGGSTGNVQTNAGGGNFGGIATTGSGSAVLATSPTITSPTLVTPALGTPVSGTLTSATGLPISTGVSGLGTGVATLLGSAASGTGAPLGGTSPTIASPTITGAFTATGLVTNGDLANSTISGVSLGSNLNTLTFGTHLTAGAASYNGSAIGTLTSDATNANTASTIVARDASGNFTAGTITASLTGAASLNLLLTGGTLTGELITPASATGGAGLNLPPGTAPTSPNNGDLWTTSGGIYVRIAGATVGPLSTGGGGVTIGNAVSGGTNSTSLYVNSSGNLANSTSLPFALLTTPVALTASSTTFTPTLGSSDQFTFTLVASTDTVANPTGGTVGQQFTMVISQPSSGGPYTIGTWGTGYTWAAGSPPTLATAASATTVVTCQVLAATPTLLCWGPVNSAFTASTVQSPTAPNSTSAYTMQGFAGTVTPATTGNVELEVCGTIVSAGTTTATIGIQFQLSYGTGTAPTTNATLTGTQVGPVYKHWNGSTLGAATDGFTPGCWAADVALTAGTTYWVDVAAESVGTASDMGFASTQVKAHEYR